jgi:hypothetical protein
MIVYHEVTRKDLPDILKEGIKRESKGSKTNEIIQKTDDFLDSHVPPELAKQGVCRNNNIYAYVADDGHIIDITDGRHKSITDFARQSDGVILAIEIDPSTCYVSDLDAYDEVKQAVQNNADEHTLTAAAASYWARLVRLDQFKIDSIKRPEVMIPHDINPGSLSLVSPADQ